MNDIKVSYVEHQERVKIEDSNKYETFTVDEEPDAISVVVTGKHPTVKLTYGDRCSVLVRRQARPPVMQHLGVTEDKPMIKSDTLSLISIHGCTEFDCWEITPHEPGVNKLYQFHGCSIYVRVDNTALLYGDCGEVVGVDPESSECKVGAIGSFKINNNVFIVVLVLIDESPMSSLNIYEFSDSCWEYTQELVLAEF